MAISEPKCVQWKRRGQLAIRQQVAGMSPEEELAYWNESHQKLMRTRAASKRRMQVAQKAGGPPAKRGTTVMPEPKCVQWKRQWRASRKKSAGASRAEESR